MVERGFGTNAGKLDKVERLSGKPRKARGAKKSVCQCASVPGGTVAQWHSEKNQKRKTGQQISTCGVVDKCSRCVAASTDAV